MGNNISPTSKAKIDLSLPSRRNTGHGEDLTASAQGVSLLCGPDPKPTQGPLEMRALWLGYLAAELDQRPSVSQRGDSRCCRYKVPCTCAPAAWVALGVIFGLSLAGSECQKRTLHKCLIQTILSSLMNLPAIKSFPTFLSSDLLQDDWYRWPH